MAIPNSDQESLIEKGSQSLQIDDIKSSEKTAVKVVTEEAPVNTQAFWLLVWMAK